MHDVVGRPRRIPALDGIVRRSLSGCNLGANKTIKKTPLNNKNAYMYNLVLMTVLTMSTNINYLLSKLKLSSLESAQNNVNFA